MLSKIEGTVALIWRVRGPVELAALERVRSPSTCCFTGASVHALVVRAREHCLSSQRAENDHPRSLSLRRLRTHRLILSGRTEFAYGISGTLKDRVRATDGKS
jgi:hypothetical protein